MRNDCDNYKEGRCSVAETLAGLPCAVPEAACAACQLNVQPMTTNVVTRGVAASALFAVGQDDKAKKLCKTAVKKEKAHAAGPATCNAGTLLTQAISELAQVKATSGCGCKTLAAEMNRNGLAWCKRNAETRIIPRLVQNRVLLAESLGLSEVLLLSRASQKIAHIAARKIVKSVLEQAVETLE
jgi:hypothetical protein